MRQGKRSLKWKICMLIWKSSFCPDWWFICVDGCCASLCIQPMVASCLYPSLFFIGAIGSCLIQSQAPFLLPVSELQFSESITISLSSQGILRIVGLWGEWGVCLLNNSLFKVASQDFKMYGVYVAQVPLLLLELASPQKQRGGRSKERLARGWFSLDPLLWERWTLAEG